MMSGDYFYKFRLGIDMCVCLFEEKLGGMWKKKK